jgi:lysophospholipase L1-like esterase
MKTRTKIFLAIGIAVVITTTIILIVATKKFRLKNKNPKKILFVGDSQVAIKNASGEPITYTYPNIVKSKNPDKQIDVVALGGKKTSWMVENIKEALKNNKYDRVYLHGGGNDVNSPTPLTETLSNFQEMVNLSNQNGADVFIVLGYKIEGESGKFGNINVLPLTQYVTTPEQWIPYVEKRKELQKLLGSKIQNANIVPIYDLQSETSDGIHPNANGHKIVAEKILQTL